MRLSLDATWLLSLLLSQELSLHLTLALCFYSLIGLQSVVSSILHADGLVLIFFFRLLQNQQTRDALKKIDEKKRNRRFEFH